jgi:hypothetical protein
MGRTPSFWDGEISPLELITVADVPSFVEEYAVVFYALNADLFGFRNLKGVLRIIARPQFLQVPNLLGTTETRLGL